MSTLHPFSRGLLLVLALTGLLACEERLPPELIDQSIRPARVMTVTLGNQHREIELVGRVEAARSIDLAFEVSGPLKQLPVREGQEVAKGAVLASLDQSDFQLAVREAEVELQLAQQDLDRKARVLAQRGIARSAVDDARAMRDLQRVRLNKAKETLKDATLRAPFSGRVAQRFVDGFANVNAAQPILRLHAGNELYVVANVPEHFSATLTPEDIKLVYCQFSFSGNEQFPLTFRENSGEADGIAQTVQVSFALSQKNGPQNQAAQWNILPGMTASVTIQLQDSGVASVVVPATAIVADAEQRLFVWLVDTNQQTVSKRYISVANSQPDGVLVVDGLSNGDVLVTTGAATLSEGIKIRPMRDNERV